MNTPRRHRTLTLALVAGTVLAAGQVQATAGHPDLSVHDSRVTSDDVSGSYTRYDGHVDAVMAACSVSRRAQSEGSVSIDPHNPQVIMVTATDRCNHFTSAAPNGGEEGIYRSTDGGRTWSASLAPGYEGDTSPAAANGIKKFCTSPTRGESDSTISFAMDGTAYLGFQCGNGIGPLAELVATYDHDGSHYLRTIQAGPRPAGAADDKPNLIVDRSPTASRGTIYMAWDRNPGGLPGSLSPQIVVARSIDHGQTFLDSAPITSGTGTYTSLAVGPDGTVYLAYVAEFAPLPSGLQIMVARSTDHGQTFSTPTVGASIVDGQTFLTAMGCGDGPAACHPDYTGPKLGVNGAITADATGVHLVWNALTPQGQGKIYAANSIDGLSWPATGTTLDNITVGDQFQPAITSAGGIITAVFYDSRVDPAYAPLRPVGNTVDGKNSGPALDSYVAQSRDGGLTWSERRVSSRSWNPNWESYLYARAPFMGDYTYADSIPGKAFVVWTDSRDVVPGTDSRDTGASDGFDVYAPCAWAPGDINQTDYTAPNYHDPCLSEGGLDQNIYGAALIPNRR